MNSTQNKKIRQVTEKTMVVGIDVGSVKHYFRAFEWRGIRRLIPFTFGVHGTNVRCFRRSIRSWLKHIKRRKYDGVVDIIARC